MNDTTFQGDGKIAFVPVVVNAKPPKKTNADRIRAMTDEELAEAICKVELMSEKHGHRGFQAWLDWLKEEADNGKN